MTDTPTHVLTAGQAAALLPPDPTSKDTVALLDTLGCSMDLESPPYLHSRPTHAAWRDKLLLCTSCADDYRLAGVVLITAESAVRSAAQAVTP